MLQPIGPGLPSEPESLVKGNLLELLILFINQHGFRIRYLIIDNNIMSKVLQLLKCKDKHLVLGMYAFANIPGFLLTPFLFSCS